MLEGTKVKIVSTNRDLNYNAKKICMVAYTFYEMDNRVRRYAEALVKRGDHVDVIALLDTTAANGNNVSKFEMLCGVNVYRIQKREINERGKLSYLFRILLFLFKSSLFLLLKHIKNKYDLIHIHSIPDFEVFAAVIPKIMGAKIILDIHDIVPEFYSSKFNVKKNSVVFRSLIFLEKISIAFSDHLIIANHIWQKKLVSRSVSDKKCSVYLNYPDQNIFYPRKRVRDDDKFVIIYPGSLNWHQGIDIAVSALAVVLKKISNVEFHIYGDGAEKQNILRSAEQLKIQDKIHFMPMVSLDKIADVISNADLGVVPKRKDSFGNEAFSTKIFEFMSLGVPVVAADTKIDKYYFDDSTIMFFESGNISDLAEKLLTVINSSKIRKNLVENGFKFIKENSWDVHKIRYFELVDSLIRL